MEADYRKKIAEALEFLMGTGEQFAINLTHTSILKAEGKVLTLKGCENVDILMNDHEYQQAKSQIQNES